MKKKIIIAAAIIVAFIGIIAAILVFGNMQRPTENESSAHISENSQADEEGSAQGKSSDDDENSESGQKSKIELPIIPME